MRVCPKCGHHDPFYWKGGIIGTVEFARFDLFEQDYPELAKLLLEAQKKYGTRNFVFDKDYCYHLTKGMNVERQSLIENPNQTAIWKIPQEASPERHPSAWGRTPAHHGKTKPRIWEPDRLQTTLDKGDSKK